MRQQSGVKETVPFWGPFSMNIECTTRWGWDCCRIVFGTVEVSVRGLYPDGSSVLQVGDGGVGGNPE